MTNKLKIVNDPVHGFIKIPHEILFDIIEHPYFQRLRNISQTGLLSLVFPGATHTRFHHALGAMHLMNCALDTLKLKGVEISKEEEKSAMIAILLHDIGHGPFSHALENVLLNDWHHEKISLLIMKKLNQEFNNDFTIALEMFQGKYKRKFFNQLISSQLDVDRLDYLKRDSFYTGVSEGSINTERIISMLNVLDDELVVDEKGIYSIENYLTARMFMYWQVYFHKTAVIAEDLLVRILKRVKKLIASGISVKSTENLDYFLHKTDFENMNDEDLSRFSQLDDADILQAIKYWKNHDDFVLSYLCKTIVYRDLPKTISSNSKFPEDVVNDKIEYINASFNIKEGNELVYQISKSLLPYDKNNQPIYLLQKDFSKVKLEDSENQILLDAMMHKKARHILTFPREI